LPVFWADDLVKAIHHVSRVEIGERHRLVAILGQALGAPVNVLFRKFGGEHFHFFGRAAHYTGLRS
jgi:hypothetical protein